MHVCRVGRDNPCYQQWHQVWHKMKKLRWGENFGANQIVQGKSVATKKQAWDLIWVLDTKDRKVYHALNKWATGYNWKWQSKEVKTQKWANAIQSDNRLICIKFLQLSLIICIRCLDILTKATAFTIFILSTTMPLMVHRCFPIYISIICSLNAKSKEFIESNMIHALALCSKL